MLLPAFNELFAAEKGKPATLNGKPIHVSREGVLRRGMIVHEPRIRKTPVIAKQSLADHHALLDKAGSVRALGSAVYGLTAVARGNLVAYVEEDIKLWDFAAGGLIVQQAGGRMTQLDGSSWEKGFSSISATTTSSFIASNGLVHREVVEMLITGNRNN